MVVQFKSDVGTFTSFGDVAVKLLRMAGHSGTVPGAIPADEVPRALALLEAALAREPGESAPAATGGGDREDKEPPVSLAQRAFPLLELLRDASREQSGIMWDKG